MPVKGPYLGEGVTVVGPRLLFMTGVNMVVHLLGGVDMFYWTFSAIHNLMISTTERGMALCDVIDIV
jgi:hypothetical protein